MQDFLTVSPVARSKGVAPRVLSDLFYSRRLEDSRGRTGRRALVADQPRPLVGCLVLDRRLCRGPDVKADPLGERHVLLLPLFVLFGEVPGVIAAKGLPASVSGACRMGSSPGFASKSNQAALRSHSGSSRNDVDGAPVERRFVGDQLGADLASVVHGSDSAEDEQRNRTRSARSRKGRVTT